MFRQVRVDNNNILNKDSTNLKDSTKEWDARILVWDICMMQQDKDGWIVLTTLLILLFGVQQLRVSSISATKPRLLLNPGY